MTVWQLKLRHIFQAAFPAQAGIHLRFYRLGCRVFLQGAISRQITLRTQPVCSKMSRATAVAFCY